MTNGAPKTALPFGSVVSFWMTHLQALGFAALATTYLVPGVSLSLDTFLGWEVRGCETGDDEGWMGKGHTVQR